MACLGWHGAEKCVRNGQKWRHSCLTVERVVRPRLPKRLLLLLLCCCLRLAPELAPGLLLLRGAARGVAALRRLHLPLPVMLLQRLRRQLPKVVAEDVAWLDLVLGRDPEVDERVGRLEVACALGGLLVRRRMSCGVRRGSLGPRIGLCGSAGVRVCGRARTDIRGSTVCGCEWGWVSGGR